MQKWEMSFFLLFNLKRYFELYGNQTVCGDNQMFEKLVLVNHYYTVDDPDVSVCQVMAQWFRCFPVEAQREPAWRASAFRHTSTRRCMSSQYAKLTLCWREPWICQRRMQTLRPLAAGTDDPSPLRKPQVCLRRRTPNLRAWRSASTRKETRGERR